MVKHIFNHFLLFSHYIHFPLDHFGNEKTVANSLGHEFMNLEHSHLWPQCSLQQSDRCQPTRGGAIENISNLSLLAAKFLHL